MEKIEQMDIDLPEVQEIDAKKIIKAKLFEAFKHKKGEFIVEDTSLYLDCLNGLPGPLIKWFLKTIGNKGLAEIAEKMGNKKAKAKTIIGYARSEKEFYFFEGFINGEIVKPKGGMGYGWDDVFRPENFDKSFGEMSFKEKKAISMRRKAFDKLKIFLES